MKGNTLKKQGINKAITSADIKNSNWSEIAYSFLKEFIKNNDEFMVEEVRIASKDIVPEPPSKRAWGSIILKAKKENLVKHIKYNQVQNPSAHMANASVWKRI